ncbi:hypothetical protein HK101_010321 [Irineochytrium annulatum]|nr:hypothetical protein HK101_010321 [Irineochytrium annulatum]
MRLFTESLRVEFKETVDLAISVATGDLLFTTIGTDFRSEAALLGEVVIIAARLMTTAKARRVLVMDDVTYELVKLSNETMDLGIVKAKGRANGVHAYAIALKSDDKPEVVEVHFGYERERAIIFQRFKEWRETRSRAVVLVEAASGFGKSSLANFLINEAIKAGVPTN